MAEFDFELIQLFIRGGFMMQMVSRRTKHKWCPPYGPSPQTGLFCAVNKGLSVEKLSNKGNVGAHRIRISLWFAELTSRNVTT